MNDLHETHMRRALKEAQAALAQGQFPVGCVIAVGEKVLATGSRANSDVEFSEIDHAEIVALRKLREKKQDIDLSKVTVYSTMEPCLMCFSTLIVNGVQNVVYGYEDAMGGGTNLPLNQLAPLYKNHPMTIVPGVLRTECLELFYTFFSNPDNPYLSGTLLAEYTLKQK